MAIPPFLLYHFTFHRLHPCHIFNTSYSNHESAGGNAICPMGNWFVENNIGNAVPGKGYSVVRSGGAGTLTVNGNPNVATSYTIAGASMGNANWTHGTLQHPSSTAFGSGWHLLANPYDATLDLTLGTTPTGFDVQVQVWDALQGQYYLASSGHVGNKIAPFQAFFVHRISGATTNYNISGTMRSTATSTFYAQNNAEELTINATRAGSNLFDEAIVGFNANATDQFDADYDANKLTGSIGRHNLYSMNSGKWLNKNMLKSIAQTSTVDVGFEPGKTGDFTFNFSGLNSFDPTSYISLEDKKLNTFYDVRTGDYNFSSDSADDWNRFVLHFTPKAEIATADQNCNTPGNINITQPGTASWTYTVTDNNNATISSGTLNNSNNVTVTAPAGTYTLTLVDQ